MSSNMTFGVNIVPKTNNTYSLGNSEKKWAINGVSDPKLTDTTYNNVTTSTAGLMSAEDKIKLNSIANGAQVNTVTSVNNQTGVVSITPANIEAVATSDIINNLTSTATNKPLSAAQGKALADMLNFKMMFISKNLEIPDGSPSDPSSLTINLTADMPSGYTFWGADIYVQDGTADYKLPWFNPTLTQALWVDRYTGPVVYLKNTSSGWGTTNLYIIAFLQKQ